MILQVYITFIFFTGLCNDSKLWIVHSSGGKSIQHIEEHLICDNNSQLHWANTVYWHNRPTTSGLSDNTRCYTDCRKKGKPSEEQLYNFDLKPAVCTVMYFL